MYKSLDNTTLIARYFEGRRFKIKFTLSSTEKTEFETLFWQKFYLQSDLTLVTEGGEVKVTKALFAARSTVFKVIFGVNQQQIESEKLIIADTEYELLLALVKYIHKIHVEFNNCDFVLIMLRVTNDYNIEISKIKSSFMWPCTLTPIT